MVDIPPTSSIVLIRRNDVVRIVGVAVSLALLTSNKWYDSYEVVTAGEITLQKNRVDMAIASGS